jgi:Zn(II)-responsive transcriptional regulator
MLTIGELASQAQVSTDTLRYYERERLVTPRSRTRAGYRLYSEEDLRRLHFIKHAQDCGFSLAEVRELLQLQVSDRACCKDVRSRAVTKKLQLEQKIKALKTMSAALSHLIEVCQGDSQPLHECPILAALETAVTAPSKGEPRQ